MFEIFKNAKLHKFSKICNINFSTSIECIMKRICIESDFEYAVS